MNHKIDIYATKNTNGFSGFNKYWCGDMVVAVISFSSDRQDLYETS